MLCYQQIMNSYLSTTIHGLTHIILCWWVDFNREDFHCIEKLFEIQPSTFLLDCLLESQLSTLTSDLSILNCLSTLHMIDDPIFIAFASRQQLIFFEKPHEVIETHSTFSLNCILLKYLLKRREIFVKFQSKTSL